MFYSRHFALLTSLQPLQPYSLFRPFSPMHLPYLNHMTTSSLSMAYEHPRWVHNAFCPLPSRFTLLTSIQPLQLYSLFWPVSPAILEPYDHIVISNSIWTFQVSTQCILFMLFCIANLPSTPPAIFTFSPLHPPYLNHMATSSLATAYEHLRWVYSAFYLHCLVLLTSIQPLQLYLPSPLFHACTPRTWTIWPHSH